MISIGARTRPAMPAAATAMPMLANGFELSRICVLPVGNDVGSGRFSIADSRLLDQVSMVLSNTL